MFSGWRFIQKKTTLAIYGCYIFHPANQGEVTTDNHELLLILHIFIYSLYRLQVYGLTIVFWSNAVLSCLCRICQGEVPCIRSKYIIHDLFVWIMLGLCICIFFTFKCSFRAFVFFSSSAPRELVAPIRRDASVMGRLSALSEVIYIFINWLLFIKYSNYLLIFLLYFKLYLILQIWSFADEFGILCNW